MSIGMLLLLGIVLMAVALLVIAITSRRKRGQPRGFDVIGNVSGNERPYARTARLREADYPAPELLPRVG